MEFLLIGGPAHGEVKKLGEKPRVIVVERNGQRYEYSLSLWEQNDRELDGVWEVYRHGELLATMSVAPAIKKSGLPPICKASDSAARAVYGV